MTDVSAAMIYFLDYLRSTSFISLDFDFQAAKSLEEKLKASGVPYEVYLYPGNAHAFMNRSQEGVKRRKGMGLPDEDEAAVELAWSRFQSWMTRHLSAQV